MNLLGLKTQGISFCIILTSDAANVFWSATLAAGVLLTPGGPDRRGTRYLNIRMRCLNGRVLKPELLDTLPAEEARKSLADLVRINRYWGGHSALRRLVEDAIPSGETVTILDVGAASGDMGRRLREWRPKAQVISLDYIESHLADSTGPRVVADAFAHPFAPRSFDYVFSSLFLHHFTDEQVVELLAGFGHLEH